MNDIYRDLLDTVKNWDKRNETMRSLQHEILQLLVSNPYSAYEMKSYFKTKGKYLDYKNMHRRIKRLKEFGLIKSTESKTKQSNHNAIFYTLSETGIYYLVRQTVRPMAGNATQSQLLKEILKYSKDNVLFRTVLDPYIENKTIQNMYGTIQLNAIWQYLRACCEEIENAIGTINNTQPGGEQIFIWDDIGAGKAHAFRELKDTRLGGYLNREFKLSWLNSAEIRKFEDDRNLKISSGSNSVLISLSENNRTAILKVNRKEVKKLNVVLLHLEDGRLFVWSINVPDITMDEYATRLLSEGIKLLASQLVFGIMSKGLTEHDIKALTSDKKFIKLVRSTQEDFNKACKLIAA